MPSGRRSSGLRIDERRQGGDPPRWEVPGWSERFGVVAGISGRATADGTPFDLGLWTDRPVGEVMRPLA